MKRWITPENDDNNNINNDHNNNNDNNNNNNENISIIAWYLTLKILIFSKYYLHIQFVLTHF